MIVYVGNMLSSSGNTPSFIEVFSPKLRSLFPVVCTSDKKNKLLRLLDMVFTLWHHRNKARVVLIDTYSYQGFYYAWVIAKLSRTLNIPYIPIIHGGDFLNRIKKTPALANSFLNQADQIIAPSEYMTQALVSQGFEVLYIPNFVELKDYQFKPRMQASAKLLWVRAFHNIYNPSLAIEIVKLAREKNNKVHLCMVGPDRDGTLNECKRMVEEEGLQSFVTFTGILSREQIRNLAPAYDIFINTTTIDNRPVSVIEAMALGLVIISTNVGGIPYLITNDENGLLVESNRSDQFVASIERLTQTPALVQRLAVNARKKVEAYDWEIVRTQWINLLKPYLP